MVGEFEETDSRKLQLFILSEMYTGTALNAPSALGTLLIIEYYRHLYHYDFDPVGR